jgi:CRP/FNR family transcriptional regulator, transcriptional activator FtrB
MLGDALAASSGDHSGAVPEVPTVGEALAATPWLAAVPADTLERLAGQAVLHRVPPGSLIFEQAETPAFAQFLVGGSVDLLGVRGKDETLIELIRPVDLLLPAAVLNRQPYLLRARVRDEAHLLMVQAEGFRQAVAGDHAFCLAVLACQAAQFRRQVKQAKNVKLRSAEERVGCYLLKLAESVPRGASVRLPLEKRLIASELGMTRETLSRCLSGLARHGIRVDGEAVIIDDPAAAQGRFALDPLIDGAEAMTPLQIKRT